MVTSVAGKTYLRREISECIFDAFRPGETFRTAEAVAACKELLAEEPLDDYTTVLDALFWMRGLGLVQKTETGWRL